MKAADFHNALRALPVIAPAAFLAASGRLAILAPHPDDETLGAGGLMAAAAAAGAPPTVLVLTDGAGSHPRSKLYGPDRLVALRRAESAEAAARLGVPSRCLHHLGWPDTALPTEGPDFERLCAEVAAAIREAGAQTVLVTWDKDPHCDHEAAAAVARTLRDREAGLTLWFYPVWGWHLEPEDDVDALPPEGVRIDITAQMKAKHDAVAAHLSQMTDLIPDDPEGFRFTAAQLAPFLDRHETFFRVP